MNENTQQPAATAHSEESRQWEECVAKLSLDEATVSILSHAVNHDEEMKNAETEGYLRGRNEKIDNATRPSPIEEPAHEPATFPRYNRRSVWDR